MKLDPWPISGNADLGQCRQPLILFIFCSLGGSQPEGEFCLHLGPRLSDQPLDCQGPRVAWPPLHATSHAPIAPLW